MVSLCIGLELLVGLVHLLDIHKQLVSRLECLPCLLVWSIGLVELLYNHKQMASRLKWLPCLLVWSYW